ncbi:TNT domain-containing protein [Sphaerisporangium sp. NBC_01403]|uniref:TNT domain-containing protein n=1 Tax=Sphaerisporangium sp. NBC_01403 TaxID=2903599 RepID=UPI003253B2B3
MRNFRRRASLAAALGIVAISLCGVPAQAGTLVSTASRAGSGWVTAPGPLAVPASASLTGRAPAATKDPDETVCTAPYINEDQRLGPKNLPKNGDLGKILSGYVPLGGLPPQKFLNRYWIWAASSYRYPPDFGFAHSGGYSNGRPLITAMTLLVGEKLDRFGGEGGAFLAPIGTPFSQRGIPPTNLETFPGAPQYPCNYHTYRVSREFAVDSGPIASAFQQPGGGDQYHLVSRLIPESPQMRDEVSVSWLVENGYLERLN